MFQPVVSVSPVVLPSARNRGEDTQVRVSAPTAGTNLPVGVFSHGYGSSMRAYGPLADFWAAHGFVVVQPTHLDSRTLGLPPQDERRPHLLRLRVEDMTTVVDHLDVVTSAVPDLPGRVDPTRIAAAGHSFGGQTTGVSLGARVVDPVDGTRWAAPDPRVTAGVLLATAGSGGPDLTPWPQSNSPTSPPTSPT